MTTMLRARPLALALGLALCGGAGFRAAAQSFTLAGRVLDGESGRSVEAAHLVLLPGGRSELSDVDGRFRFPRVPAGPYTLQVRRLGFASWSLALRLPPDTGQLEVRLRAATLIDEARLAAVRPLSANEALTQVPGVNQPALTRDRRS